MWLEFILRQFRRLAWLSRDLTKPREMKIILFFITITLAGVWFLAWRFWQLVGENDLIILSYNIDLGTRLVGYGKKIFLIPILALSTNLINIGLALFVRRLGNFLVYLLLTTSLLVNIILINSLLILFFVNFHSFI